MGSTSGFQPGPDARALQQSVVRRQIREIYHFTPLAYAQSIIGEGRILCRRLLVQEGIAFDDRKDKWGWAEKADEFQDYVSCSVARPYGMMGKAERPVLFGLKSRLIWRDGTLFVSIWSSHRSVSLGAVRGKSTVEAFDAMFPNPTSNFPDPLPGEILVLGPVPLTELTILYLATQEDLDEVRAQVGRVTVPSWVPRPINARVAPWMFGR